MTYHVSSPHIRARLVALVVAAGVFLPTLVPVSADVTIAASWRSEDGLVDGSIDEWARLERVESGPAVAVQNDATSLYLAVASNDPVVREQLATGVIVWIDGTGRRRQAFGIRLDGLVRRSLPGANPGTTAASAIAEERVLNPLDEFDLLGPARLQRRLIDNPADVGMAAASGVTDGMVVYELRVPLERAGTAPHAIGAKPGTTIAVGLETPTDPRPARQRNALVNPMNTNPWVNNPYGGYFTQPPPPPGGTPREPRDEVVRPMKLLWAQVRLAASAAGSGTRP